MNAGCCDEWSGPKFLPVLVSPVTSTVESEPLACPMRSKHWRMAALFHRSCLSDPKQREMSWPIFSSSVGQGTVHRQLDLLDGRRLDQIIPDSSLDGEFRALRITLPGQHDHVRWVCVAANFSQRVESIAIGQAHIQKDEIRLLPPDPLQPIAR